MWRKLNALQPERPMVMIDQVCWNEMNVGDELTLRCSDPECRGYEECLRRTLFQWKHFPVDMVVEPFVRVPKAISNTGFGIGVQEERRRDRPTNEVVGHAVRQPVRDDGRPGEDPDAADQPRRGRDRAPPGGGARAVRRPAGGAAVGRRPVPVPVGSDQHLDGRGERALRPRWTGRSSCTGWSGA